MVAKWLGYSPEVAAQHYLMSRAHHFEDVVRGEGLGRPEWGTATAPECDAYCSALATQNATQQASALDRAQPHETTEPAAATRVTAGSSEIAPVSKTGLVAGAGREQTKFRAGNLAVASACDAQCDALSADRVELLARAVMLVAGMAISEQERAAVLARVVAGVWSAD